VHAYKYKFHKIIRKVYLGLSIDGRSGRLSVGREVNGKSRGFFDIMAEMVMVCQSGARKTHIMYKANLSYEMLQRYMKVLLDAGLVEGSLVDGSYRASPKGFSFVRDYAEFKRLGELYASKKSSLLEVIAKV
jgi:predicted transcriptional regulator